MNLRLLAPLALPLAGLLLAAAACGDGGPEIRVQKGLVAAGPAGPQVTDKGGAAIGAPPAPVPAPIPPGVVVPEAARVGFGGDIGFAPPGSFFFQGAGEGINVQGFGTASADADAATLQFFVVAGEGFYPKPVEPPSPEQLPQAQPLTEADLQPLIDAIKAQGIADADIEVIINPVYYYDPYSPGSANINVNVRDLAKLDAIVDAVRDADAAAGLVAVQNISVLYSVADCAALEREAMIASVEDARDRAQVLASVLGVGIGNVVFASHYSYSPFGYSACTPGFIGIQYGGGQPYARGQSPEVQITSQVSVTFAIQ